MITGYAAFLDVLGFSSLVASERHGERITDYLDCLQQSLEVKDAAIEYVVFSDSIVVTTADDTDVSLQKLVRGCSYAFGSLLKHKFPVRGAISHGSYIRKTTPSGRFVAGRAIVDAIQFEKKQNWCGIMVCPSVLQNVPDLADRCQRRLGNTKDEFQAEMDKLPWTAYLQSHKIPFHGSPDGYDGIAVVPTGGDPDPEKLVESLTQSVQSLRRLMSIAPDPKSQEKYKATQNSLNGVLVSWNDIVAWRKLLQTQGLI